MKQKKDEKEIGTGRSLPQNRGLLQFKLCGRAFQSLIRPQSGFTLIEIMVVITILAILSVLVVPKLVGRTDEARRVAAKVQIKNIEEGLQMYKLDNGDYPSTEQGLDALVNKPSVGETPKNWREGVTFRRFRPIPGEISMSMSAPGPMAISISSPTAPTAKGGEGKSADIESWNME
ncbi:MAG: type II secretion system major pseudopilin GspG [Candidatus Manganitrophus sp.]|nr:type II secretion system major pseudopilin GspG [Candidatus Manganitrophus sp.]